MTTSLNQTPIVVCACGCKYTDGSLCHSCHAPMPTSDAYGEAVSDLARCVIEIGTSANRPVNAERADALVADALESDSDDLLLTLYGFGFDMIHWRDLRAAVVAKVETMLNPAFLSYSLSAYDGPCCACGAEWIAAPMFGAGARALLHEDGCEYVKWENERHG